MSKFTDAAVVRAIMHPAIGGHFVSEQEVMDTIIRFASSESDDSYDKAAQAVSGAIKLQKLGQTMLHSMEEMLNVINRALAVGCPSALGRRIICSKVVM